MSRTYTSHYTCSVSADDECTQCGRHGPVVRLTEVVVETPDPGDYPYGQQEYEDYDVLRLCQDCAPGIMLRLTSALHELKDL